MNVFSGRVQALFTIVILLTLSGASVAQSGFTRAAPAEVAMSEEGLERMGAFVRTMVDDGELSGAITAVTRRGKLVHWQVHGWQDVEQQTPLTDDTIFRIYSMTKPVVGVALMTFYEEGRFDLDDPVEKYLPELAGLEVFVEEGPPGKPATEPAAHPLTIRELVSHTGGFTYGLFSRSQIDTMYLRANLFDRTQTLEAFIGKLAEIPLKYQPGTDWQYSVSVDVQGYLLQVLAGKPFEDVLAERIFAPLGMKDTAFWVPPAKADRLATLYVRNQDGKVVARPNGEYLTEPGFPSGGGGLVGTAGDYLRFAQMLANEGELEGVRILKPETVELLHTNQLPAGVEYINPRIGNPGNTFGIDFAIVAEPDGQTDHLRAKGEFWWYGIGGTWFGVNPVHDLVILGMIQNQAGAARKARIGSKKLVYEAIVE